ncbi:MAG: hypothetical protein K0S71_2668 [Clostridia bacterium]|jgi:diguanylate cyclase (GGDEF)-like protein/PAS domain S-box-containing protein|nr:hypothetical protein [Clostridia bacterium]
MQIDRESLENPFDYLTYYITESNVDKQGVQMKGGIRMMLYVLHFIGMVIIALFTAWISSQRYKKVNERERDLMYNMLDKAETMVVVWKDDLSFLNINGYMKAKLGYAAEENKKVFDEIFHINETNKQDRIREMLCSKKSTEKVIDCQNGDTKYVMWRSIIWSTDREGVRTILSIGFDITDRVKLSKELEIHSKKIKSNADTIQKLAFEDELTGLYNKRKFLIEGNAILEASEGNKQYALMYIDVDKFSFINSIYGEKVGNNVLKKVAAAINRLIPKDAICCRRGDDEFAVLFAIENEKDINLLYEKLVRHISSIKIKDNVDYRVEISAGAVVYPSQGDEINKLYQNVTFVMQDIKRKHTKTLALFDSELKERVLHQQVIAMELKEAIRNNEFILYYQPKIDVITEKLVGMEALVRWKHSKEAFMSPGQFIPIAEQTGLIIELGKWGLLEACIQNKRWQDRGAEKYIVSVNISATEFYQNNMLEIIKEALKVSGLDPCCLEIELTESMAIIDKEQTIAKMNEIRALGIKVALDDFGTGYSSLSYLKVLPIDILKLDRSFVSEIEKDNISKNITLTMIRLAELLNIETVAEGVETKEQAELLKKMGCHTIQGYYYSRPLPADIFEEVYLHIKK